MTLHLHKSIEKECSLCKKNRSVDEYSSTGCLTVSDQTKLHCQESGFVQVIHLYARTSLFFFFLTDELTFIFLKELINP